MASEMFRPRVAACWRTCRITAGSKRTPNTVLAGWLCEWGMAVIRCGRLQRMDLPWSTPHRPTSTPKSPPALGGRAEVAVLRSQSAPILSSAAAMAPASLTT